MDDRARNRNPGRNPGDDAGQRPPIPSDKTPLAAPPREIGGPQGPEPTRHGDREYNGRCPDF